MVSTRGLPPAAICWRSSAAARSRSCLARSPNTCCQPDSVTYWYEMYPPEASCSGPWIAPRKSTWYGYPGTHQPGSAKSETTLPFGAS